MSVCVTQVIIKTLQLLLTLMNQESGNRDSFLCKVKMECSLGLVRFSPTHLLRTLAPPRLTLSANERTNERTNALVLRLPSVRAPACSLTLTQLLHLM